MKNQVTLWTRRFSDLLLPSILSRKQRLLSFLLAVTLSNLAIFGQSLVISSFSGNGELKCTNIAPDSVATVEWAPTINGPWSSSWAGLDGVPVDSKGELHVQIPMFYRVRAVPRIPLPDPARMAWIPPGTFIMGSPTTEATRAAWEGPQTRTTISKGFWMGRFEVTQEDYIEVTGRNPSHFQGDLRLPVEQVTWHDAQAYCAELTVREQALGHISSNFVYRLPTAAEWEYACRAGGTTAFSFGPALRTGMANFDGTSEYPPCGNSTYECVNAEGINLGQTSRVGSYEPNAWGLFDMHGNVWEWCQDWFSSALPGGSATDPTGPATGSAKVMRGGRWGYSALFCRSAGRGYLRPDAAQTTLGDGLDEGGVGFRIVLSER